MTYIPTQHHEHKVAAAARAQHRRAFNFDEALRLLRKHDPEVRETGFGLLQAHAPECVERLIAEFDKESDHGLRCWLLELIGEARSSMAIPIFLEYLRSEDDSLRAWAIRGLKKLDTKEARRLLWEAGA